MVDREVLDEARRFVNWAWLASEMVEPDRTTCWVFEVTDPEVGTAELYGPFHTREDALEHAASYRDEMTKVDLDLDIQVRAVCHRS